MSNNSSTTTKPVAFRLSNDVYEMIDRRAKHMGIKISDYIKRRVVYDATRQHGKGK